MDEESGLRVTRSRRRMSIEQDSKPIETTPAPATPTTAKANRRMSIEREVKIPDDNASATPTRRKPGRMSIKPELPNVIENVILGTPLKKSPELPAKGGMSILPSEVKVILEDVVVDSPSKRTRSRKGTGATDDEGSDARVQTGTPTKKATRNLAGAVDSPRTRRISRRLSVTGNENEVENPVDTPLKRKRSVSHSVISPLTQIGKANVSPIGQSVKTPAKHENEMTNENSPNSNVTLVRRDDSISPIRKSPRLKNSPKEVCAVCPSNTTSPEKTHVLVEASPTKAERKSLSMSLKEGSKIGKCESPINVFAPKGDIGKLEPPQPMDVDDSFQFNDTSFGSSGLVNDSVSAPEKSHQCHGKEISINIKNDDNTSFKVSFTSSSTSIDILGTGNAAKKNDTDTTADSPMIKKKISRNSSLNESGNKSKTPTKKASVNDNNDVINLDTTTESDVEKNKRNSLNESKNSPKTTTDSITTKTQKKRNSIVDKSKTMEQSGDQSIKNAEDAESSTDTTVGKNAESATPKAKGNFRSNEPSNKTVTPTIIAQEVVNSDMNDADFNKPTKNKRQSLNKSANQSFKNSQEIQNSTDADVDNNGESATLKTKRTSQSNESINKTTTPTRIAQEVGKSDTSDADFGTPTGDSISTENKRKSSNNAKTPIKSSQDNGPSDSEPLKMERKSESGHKIKTPVKNSNADIKSPTGGSISNKNKRKSLNNANTPIMNVEDDGPSNVEPLIMKTNSESGNKTRTPVKNATNADIETPTEDSMSTKNKRKSLNKSANQSVENAQEIENADVDKKAESATPKTKRIVQSNDSINKTKTPTRIVQEVVKSDMSNADFDTPAGDSISTENKRKSLNNIKTPIKKAEGNGQSDPEPLTLNRNSESGHKTPVKNAQETESSNNRNSSLDKSIARAKTATGNSAKKARKNDTASEIDSTSDPGNSSRKTQNKSSDDSAEFPMLLLSESGNTSRERLISSTSSGGLNSSKSKNKSVILNANSDDDFIEITNKSNSGISSTEEGGLMKKRLTSAEQFLSEKVGSKTLPINTRKNDTAKQHVSYGDSSKHSPKLLKNIIATSTPNVNKAGNDASKPTSTSETVCLDSESEESEDDNSLIDDECEEADDDYESGDSMSASEHDLIENNKIPDLGETLDSASSISTDNSISNDSFIVSSDEKDEELLSGTGDDLSSGDDELTFSAKSKQKFNKKAAKTQKNASSEMYRSRHAADESDDEIVAKPKLNKSKNKILSDVEENDATSGTSENITVIDNTKKHEEEDDVSSLSEGDDIKVITSDYNKILKDLETEHTSKLADDASQSKTNEVKRNIKNKANYSINSDFGISALHATKIEKLDTSETRKNKGANPRKHAGGDLSLVKNSEKTALKNETVNASQSKTNEVKRSSKRKANYSINSDFGISALHATEMEKLDTSETKKNTKASPRKQAGGDLSSLKNDTLKDTHKAANTSKESVSKKRKRDEVDEKRESVFIAPLPESILSQLTDSSEQPKKKKTKVASGFTVEELQGGECELDMTIIDEEPPTFVGSSGDFKVVKKAKVKVPLGACRPSKSGSTTDFQVTSSCSTTKFKVVAADKHPKKALKINSYLSNDILNFRNERLFGSNVKRMDNKKLNSVKEKLIASARSYMRD